MGNLHFGGGRWVLTGIEVAVPKREVAARYVQSDAVPRAEQVARCVQIDGVFGDFARIQQLRFTPHAVTEPCADHPLGDVQRSPVGKDIAQTSHKIRVPRRGRCEERRFDESRHFHVAFERLAGIHEHIAARFHLTLIVRSGFRQLVQARVVWPDGMVATGGRHRIVGVVRVAIRRFMLRRRPVEHAIRSNVKRPRHRARGRPLVFVAPAVLAHDEDTDGRGKHLFRIPAAQQTVKPPVRRVGLGERFRSEIDFSEMRYWANPVRPRPDYDTVALPKRFRCRDFTQPVEHPQRVGGVVVVPSRHEQHR